MQLHFVSVRYLQHKEHAYPRLQGDSCCTGLGSLDHGTWPPTVFQPAPTHWSTCSMAHGAQLRNGVHFTQLHSLPGSNCWPAYILLHCHLLPAKLHQRHHTALPLPLCSVCLSHCSEVKPERHTQGRSWISSSQKAGRLSDNYVRVLNQPFGLWCQP